MSAKTGIEWTDATWNPTEGCTMAPGSEKGGCLNCYAARLALRRPGSGLAIMRPSGPRWTGKVGPVEHRLEEPLKWRAPKRIFVNSMSDLFHESLSDEAIDRVFAVMALCPQHTFQILTKRPGRMLEYMTAIRWDENANERGEELQEQIYAMSSVETTNCLERWPLPNVWLGVSVENQTTADDRIPLLLQTSASRRFISYEPALGPVNFCELPSVSGIGRYLDSLRNAGAEQSAEISTKIDWIIVGGESGPGARPFDIEWARSTIEQCRDAGVACFVKQFGSNPVMTGTWSAEELRGFDPQCAPLEDLTGMALHLNDRKGGEMSEWPEDLRVRQFPEAA